MSRVYYAVRYRLDHKDRWLLWHSDDAANGLEADGIVVDQTSQVPVFRTPQGLATYAETNNLLPLENDNSAFYNFDAVEKWLKRKRPTQLDCVEFLNAWNLLADLSATISGDFDSDKIETGDIYSKLFWGSNIPAITPPGKHYDPVWVGRESRIIRQVIEHGLSLFRRNILQAEPKSTSHKKL